MFDLFILYSFFIISSRIIVSIFHCRRKYLRKLIDKIYKGIFMPLFTFYQFNAIQQLYIIYLSMANNLWLIAFAILALIPSAHSEIRYCQLETSELKLFSTANELQQVPLADYVRGYNLHFQSTNSTLVDVFQPYNVAQQAVNPLPQGYSILNIDEKSSLNSVLGRQGVIVAFDGSKTLAVTFPSYKYDLLPVIDKYTFYMLPQESNCYSARIINDKLDVVVDCESKDLSKDYLCSIPLARGMTCMNFESITGSNFRKSLVLQYDSSSFFITASLADYINPGFKNQTYLTIYNLVNGQPVFNMIVDRRTLKLPSLSINDVDLIQKQGITYIMISDTNLGIITFRYLQENQISDVSVMKVGLPARQAVVCSGGFFVANDRSIEHYSQKLELVKQYELDISDSKIIDLQVSPNLLMARTEKNNVYTYWKKLTQIKYLLNKEQVEKDTAILMSPYFSRIIHIGDSKMRSIAVSSGYLLVSDVQSASTVQILAHSGNMTCKLNIMIDVLPENTTVYKKKQINTDGYKFGANDRIWLPLNSYFGGKKLDYRIKSPAQKDISYTIQHIDTLSMSSIKFQQNQNIQVEEDVYRTEILDVNAQVYLYITFSTTFIKFYQCGRNFIDNSILCIENQSDRIPLADNSPKVILSETAYREPSNEYILTWVNENQVIGIKVLNKSGYSLILSGAAKSYSGITISEKYIIYTQKVINLLEIYDGHELKRISKNSFSPDDLATLGGGFYPRDVLVDFDNPNILYIKSPISVITAAYFGDQNMQVLFVNKVSDVFIPDSKWSITAGTSSFFVTNPSEMAEYSILPNSQIQKLHKIDLGGKKPAIPFQIDYSEATNTIYLMTDDNTLQFIKLNSPRLQSQFYEVTGLAQNGEEQWVVSGSWIMLTTSGKILYQHPDPSLLIVTNSEQDGLSTFDFDLEVSSQNQGAVEVKTKISSMKYKTAIGQSSVEDNGVTLPATGNNSMVPIAIEEYFTGAVSKYEINCPFSISGNLKLSPPFIKISDNQGVAGYSDITNLPDNLGVVIVQDNILKVINIQNQVQSTIYLEQIQGECNNLQLNDHDLVVLCISGSTQQVLLFSVNQKNLTQSGHYYLSEEGFASNPFEIGIYRASSTALYMLIHDADPLTPEQKNSNIKLFSLENQTMEFVEIIDSNDFGTVSTEPINSMSLSDNHLILTIGGKGLGYYDLETYPSAPSFIHLTEIPEMAKYLFDDTTFLRTVLIKADMDAKKMQILLTTTNSVHFILECAIGETSVSYSKIIQIFNRYGSQQSLNWASVDEKILLLSYYKMDTTTQSIAFYRRSADDQNITNFFYAKEFIIPYTQLHPPRSDLIYVGTIQEKSNLLFIQNRQIPSSRPSMSLYNVTGEFNLVADYEEPGNFDTIEVTASNAFGEKAVRNLEVSFDGNNSSGLKWYAVLITICLVLLVVGVAAGLYMRMKGKKGDSKKVSLYTEEEEVNERI